MQMSENWNPPYVSYEIINKRKFDDHMGKNKDKKNLKEWLEILLLDRNVLIYFQNDEIRVTLKGITEIPPLSGICLERDADSSNFFTAWEIEKNKFVVFHYSDVKKIVVRSEGITELGSYENQLKFRSDKSKISNNESSES
jgi:hypothetical protein